MGLGVLEDHKLDHVPGTLSCYIGLHNDANLNTGTSYVNENPDFQPQPDQRPWLKYDRSGPVPILLIPQPSDDPYDPLVCSLHWQNQTSLTRTELAAMAPRPNPRNPLPRRRHLRNHESHHGRQHRHHRPRLQKGLYAGRLVDGLSSPRRWVSGYIMCAHSQNMGEATSIYNW